jgi:hypothetical protein
VGEYSTSPLDDPAFDFIAWTQKHLDSSAEIAEEWVKAVAEEWVKAVVEEYSEPKNTKFACVGYW